MGMDTILKLGIQIIIGGESLGINRLYENNEELVEQLLEKYPKLFNENHTVQDLEVKIELKPGHKPVQQKGRRILIHLQAMVKLAMDARILNDNTIKRTAQMPNLEELLGQVSLSITKDENLPLYISTIDLEYAFGQIKLHTRKHCNIAIIGGEATRYYQLKKGF